MSLNAQIKSNWVETSPSEMPSQVEYFNVFAPICTHILKVSVFRSHYLQSIICSNNQQIYNPTSSISLSVKQTFCLEFVVWSKERTSTWMVNKEPISVETNVFLNLALQEPILVSLGCTRYQVVEVRAVVIVVVVIVVVVIVVVVNAVVVIVVVAASTIVRGQFRDICEKYLLNWARAGKTSKHDFKFPSIAGFKSKNL